MSGVLRRDAEICNSKGLHARAAAKFCKTAEQFEAEILVKRGDTEVSGRSIMGLMMLGRCTRHDNSNHHLRQRCGSCHDCHLHTGRQ